MELPFSVIVHIPSIIGKKNPNTDIICVNGDVYSIIGAVDEGEAVRRVVDMVAETFSLPLPLPYQIVRVREVSAEEAEYLFRILCNARPERVIKG